MVEQNRSVFCLKCGDRNIIKRGKRVSKSLEEVKRYMCKGCKYRFSVYPKLWKEERYKKQIIKNRDNAIEFELTPKERIHGLILPQELSEDLAYFCGVLAGDGSIRYQETKKQYDIQCAGNPKDEIEYYNKIIIPLIRGLFNITTKPKYLSKSKIYGFNICSKNLVKFLTEYIGLPLGKKYGSLSLPKIFLKDKRLARNFISGLADTDFHLQIRRGNYPIIKGVSKSKRFIKEIKEFLEKDGFKCNAYKREQYDSRVKKTVVTYSLELNGHEQFNAWMHKIGFRHPKVIPKIRSLNKNRLLSSRNHRKV